MILVAIRLKENQEAPSELGLLEEERGLSASVPIL